MHTVENYTIYTLHTYAHTLEAYIHAYTHSGVTVQTVVYCGLLGFLHTIYSITCTTDGLYILSGKAVRTFFIQLIGIFEYSLYITRCVYICTYTNSGAYTSWQNYIDNPN